MTVACVIPARFASQRLPGKPLLPLRGRPMIVWVIDAARRMDFVDLVLVATDHDGIAAAARQAGAEAVMTNPDLPSGTDRIQAAMAGREADVVINLQGDEPGMPAETVRLAYEALQATGADVATACVPIVDRLTFESPNAVKVVRTHREMALYFSRSPIPSLARRPPESRSDGMIFGHKHLGLYLYRREALEKFCHWPVSPLEELEKLEQLRLLENGLSIVCVESSRDSIGVDTEEDIARAEQYLATATP